MLETEAVWRGVETRKLDVGISYHEDEQSRRRVMVIVTGHSCPYKILQWRGYSTANYCQHYMLLVPERGTIFRRVNKKVGMRYSGDVGETIIIGTGAYRIIGV